MPFQIAGLAERMDMHPVGHLTCHAQHPRIHRRDIHLGIRRVDGSRAPLRSDEVEAVEVAVVIKCPRSERREARLHRQHIVAQPRAGTFEGRSVATHDVRANLRAQAQPEFPAGRLLKLPRRGRRNEGTTRKSYRDTGGQLESGSGLRGHCGVEIGSAAGLRKQQTRKPCRLSTPGQVTDLP